MLQSNALRGVLIAPPCIRRMFVYRHLPELSRQRPQPTRDLHFALVPLACPELRRAFGRLSCLGSHDDVLLVVGLLLAPAVGQALLFTLRTEGSVRFTSPPRPKPPPPR